MPDIQVDIYIYVRTFSVGVHGASPNFGKDFSESTIEVSKSRFNLTRNNMSVGLYNIHTSYSYRQMLAKLSSKTSMQMRGGAGPSPSDAMAGSADNGRRCSDGPPAPAPTKPALKQPDL